MKTSLSSDWCNGGFLAGADELRKEKKMILRLPCPCRDNS